MGAKEEEEERAEQLEREARDAIAEGRRECGLRLACEALAIRQAFQGEAHRDLIWPLSLCIEALRRDPDSALEAARLGERRLALRRVALAGAPDELACSLRELMDLYRFEGQVLLDARRVDELRRELAALPDPTRRQVRRRCRDFRQYLPKQYSLARPHRRKGRTASP